MSGSMVEWAANGQSAEGYLALPAQTPAPGIIVIQEWWGLEPHIKSVVDRFAGAGFVALAPDLYHGQVTSEPDEARKLAMDLDRQRAMTEIHGAADYLRGRSDVSGELVGVVGFCMGGGLTGYVACTSDRYGAAVVFYGSPPQPLDLVEQLSCPLLGHYGEADHGIPLSAVEAFRQALDEAGKTFELHVYPDAPHAFFNDTRKSYRPDAAELAWRRTVDFFNAHLPRRGGSGPDNQ